MGAELGIGALIVALLVFALLVIRELAVKHFNKPIIKTKD